MATLQAVGYGAGAVAGDDVARQFVEAATRIDDATARLKALSQASDSGNVTVDEEFTAIHADLKASVARYREAEEALWNAIEK